MIETSPDRRTRAAYRAAHDARADAFRTLLAQLFLCRARVIRPRPRPGG